MDKDLLKDLKPVPHREKHPKIYITFRILMSVLIIITILASIRAVRIMFPEWYYSKLEMIKHFFTYNIYYYDQSCFER
jgi:hypothetical protein